MVRRGRVGPGRGPGSGPPAAQERRLPGAGQGHAGRQLQAAPEVFPARLPGQVQLAGRRAHVGRPVHVGGGDALVGRREVVLLLVVRRLPALRHAQLATHQVCNKNGFAFSLVLALFF